jgi:hypothetical protein
LHLVNEAFDFDNQPFGSGAVGESDLELVIFGIKAAGGNPLVAVTGSFGHLVTDIGRQTLGQINANGSQIRPPW